eukprot:scaffold145989_cov33-Tisochrysis_lutea.AAC.2
MGAEFLLVRMLWVCCTPEIVWSACMCAVGCCSPVQVEVTVELQTLTRLLVLVWLSFRAHLALFACSSLYTQRAHFRLFEG